MVLVITANKENYNDVYLILECLVMFFFLIMEISLLFRRQGTGSTTPMSGTVFIIGDSREPGLALGYNRTAAWLAFSITGNHNLSS